MKKLYLIVLIILIISLIFTGCWNYRDVNKMRFVMGVAIDYDKEKQEYINTSEVVKMVEGQEIFGSTLFQSKGETVFDAVRDTIMKNARKLYWGHAKIIILSKETVNENIYTVLDYASRDQEFRDDIQILVSGEEMAKDIFEKTAEESEEIASLYIDDILENEKHISTYHAMPIWKFIEEMYDEGISPTLPIVIVSKKNGKKVPRVSGQAVLKGGKIVGALNEVETKAYLCIINKLKGTTVTVETVIEDKPVDVSMEVFKNKTRINPKKVDDKIVIEIDIETDFGIAEIAGEVNVIERKARNILKKDIEKEVKNKVENVIKKVQKEYESDIFSFGMKVKDKMPNEWRKVRSNWGEVFKNLEVDIKVDANIRGSALTSEPIKVQE